MEAEARGWRHTSKSRPPCARRLCGQTHRQRKQRLRPTMWVDRAWNYYHLRFWMKERKHSLNKKRAPFHFNCVVRTTGNIPQMISSTSKEFTFRRRKNVPLLCRDTVFRTKRIVCLVGLFIFCSPYNCVKSTEELPQKRLADYKHVDKLKQNKTQI